MNHDHPDSRTMRASWRVVLWAALSSFAFVPATAFSAGLRLVVEPAPYASVLANDAPPILDHLNTMLLSYADRNGGWNAAQFLREYTILSEKGEPPPLLPQRGFQEVIADYPELAQHWQAVYNARSVSQKQQALAAIGTLLDARMASISQVKVFLSPLHRPGIGQYNTAKAGFRFKPDVVFGNASTRRAADRVPTLGTYQPFSALLLTNLRVGRLPVEEYGLGTFGLLDLSILPAPTPESIAALESSARALHFFEIRLDSPWKSFNAPSQNLFGAIGSVNATVLRIVIAQPDGSITYAATLKELQKLPSAGQ